MTKKNIFPVVATIAVVGVVLGVFSTTVLRDSNVSISTMTSEQAYANLSSKMKRIGVQEVSVNPQQLDVSEFLDAKDELPNIDSSYPFVVEGNGDVNIEIFSSGEKAAESGSDSFLTSMAKKFNAQHNKTSGDKTIQLERGSPVPLRPEFCQRTMTPITGIHRQYHVAKLCESQTIKSE